MNDINYSALLNNVKATLNQRVATVTFKKVNGDLRVMDCTTNFDLIPPSGWPQGKIELSEETKNQTIRVYDLRAQGWRSFKIENFISIA